MKKFLLMSLLISAMSINLIAEDKNLQTNSIMVGGCIRKEDNQTTKRNNIKKILDMLFGDMTWIKELANSMTPKSDQNSKMTEELAKATEKYQNAVLADLSSDSIRKSIIDLYDKVYNEKEILDLLNFYESNTGKKLISNMPQMAAETGKIMQSVLQKHMTNFVTEATEITRKYQPTEPKK